MISRTLRCRGGERPLVALGVVALLVVVAPTASRAQASVDLPLGVGFHVPAYDRVDGLSLPFGPDITFGDERVTVEPLVTYRSNLGKIDASLDLAGQFTRDSLVGFRASAERGTFTNDRWIRSDLVNSLVTFGLGHDSRNYFRADRAEAALTSRLPVGMDDARVWIGMRTERDWSTGLHPEPSSGVLGSGSQGSRTLRPRPTASSAGAIRSAGMTRFNPVINTGHITSLVAGGIMAYTGDVLDVAGTALVEAAGHSPAGGAFQQLTIDAQTGWNTFKGERVEVNGHLLESFGAGPTPIQRYSYVGRLRQPRHCGSPRAGRRSSLLPRYRVHNPSPRRRCAIPRVLRTSSHVFLPAPRPLEASGALFRTSASGSASRTSPRITSSTRALTLMTPA